MAFCSTGGSVGSSRHASAVAYFECTCRTQRAPGTLRWMLPCRAQAVGSGASGRSIVLGSPASRSSSSLALTCEKWRPRGFIRNFVPASSTARLKWLATDSCRS